MNNTLKKKIIIIGGGITGLTSAYIAVKNNFEVVLVEASNKPGGLLSSFDIGGTKLEKFYHHFFTHDKELMWLLDELDLRDRLIFNKTTMGVFRDGKIYNFNSPLDLFEFKPFNIIDILRFGLTSIYLALFSDWKKMENIPAIEWFEKYSGKKITDTIWRPLIEGKFGPYSSKLPISWMVGRLAQRFKSREKGDEKLGYLNGSFEVLVTTIVKKLQEMGVTFYTDFTVKKITSNKTNVVSISNGEIEIFGDSFLFCTPTNVTSSLFSSINSEFSNKLSKVKYFGALCVIVELKNRFSDIYWLNIAEKDISFVGIIEQTNFIPKENYNNSNIIYLTKYYDNDSFYGNSPLEEIQELMLCDLKKIKPTFSTNEILSVRTFRTNTAAVVCDLNFSKKVPKYRTPFDNTFIASIVHVYPDERSANNSIRVAKYVCKDMGMDVTFIPTGTSLAGEIGL